uniref:Uncharacterized protein n=1 Tax=Ditylenchus dipsaci TaxID=166011 RepID=A0A915D6P5_9BILA
MARFIESTVAARPFFSSSRALRHIPELPMAENEGEMYSSRSSIDDIEAIQRSLDLLCVQQHTRYENSNSQLLLCQPRSGNPEELLSINQQTNNYPETNIAANLRQAHFKLDKIDFCQLLSQNSCSNRLKDPCHLSKAELAGWLPTSFFLQSEAQPTTL